MVRWTETEHGLYIYFSFQGSEIAGGGENGDSLNSCMQKTVLCGELEEELKVMEGWFVDQSNDIR